MTATITEVSLEELLAMTSDHGVQCSAFLDNNYQDQCPQVAHWRVYFTRCECGQLVELTCDDHRLLVLELCKANPNGWTCTGCGRIGNVERIDPL